MSVTFLICRDELNGDDSNMGKVHTCKVYLTPAKEIALA